MSYDLFLGTTKKDWTMDLTPVLRPVVPPRPGLSLTPAERERVRRLATLKAKAEGGDPVARREWRRVTTKVVALRVRARGGDPRAVRACQVIEESGLFARASKISVSGDLPRKKDPFAKDSTLPRKENPFTKVDAQADKEISLGEFVGDEERAASEAGRAELAADERVGSWYSPFRALGRRIGKGLKKVGTAPFEIVRNIAQTGPVMGDVGRPVRASSLQHKRIIHIILRQPDGSTKWIDPDKLNPNTILRMVGRGGHRGMQPIYQVSGVEDSAGESGQWRGRGREKRRHLRRLIRRSLRGDAGASSRLQQLSARLTQRAQAGDARASALLQRVQQETAREQARLSTQPATYPAATPYAATPTTFDPTHPGYVPPATTPPPGAPPAAPPPATSYTYAAPAQYDDSYSDY